LVLHREFEASLLFFCSDYSGRDWDSGMLTFDADAGAFDADTGASDADTGASDADAGALVFDDDATSFCRAACCAAKRATPD
jgi:hypothetical protein